MPCKIKTFSLQGLDANRSVSVAALCHSDPISKVPTNEQLLAEKGTCAKFQFDR